MKIGEWFNKYTKRMTAKRKKLIIVGTKKDQTNDLYSIVDEMIKFREENTSFLEWQAEMMLSPHVDHGNDEMASAGDIDEFMQKNRISHHLKQATEQWGLPHHISNSKHYNDFMKSQQQKRDKIIEQTLHRWQTENVSVEKLMLARSALAHYLTGNETICSMEFQMKRANMLEEVIPFLDAYREEVLFPLIAKVQYKKKEIRFELGMCEIVEENTSYILGQLKNWEMIL